MHPKDSQFPRLAPGDKPADVQKSNIRGKITTSTGIMQYNLPKDSPHVEHDYSGGFLAKQGPLQPGKDFKNRSYVMGNTGDQPAEPSRDYLDYQLYN